MPACGEMRLMRLVVESASHTPGSGGAWGWGCAARARRRGSSGTKVTEQDPPHLAFEQCRGGRGSLLFPMTTLARSSVWHAQRLHGARTHESPPPGRAMLQIDWMEPCPNASLANCQPFGSADRQPTTATDQLPLPVVRRALPGPRHRQQLWRHHQEPLLLHHHRPHQAHCGFGHRAGGKRGRAHDRVVSLAAGGHQQRCVDGRAAEPGRV